jgi:hypothetical protein
MDLAGIQHAIEEFDREQEAALAVWLAERDQEAWDAELERDSHLAAPAAQSSRK